MSAADWIVLILAVGCVAVAIAAWQWRRRRGKTGCGGGCSGCPYSGGCSREKTDAGDRKR